MIYQIIYEKNPSHEDTNRLNQGISEYAKAIRGHAPIEPFAFFIRDEKNEIKGGCAGAIIYGCLYVDILWVDESLRHQGYGTKLMQPAEKLGREKGCTFATVNTMDWEALEFYKKLGFHVEFERHGYAKNSIFYFLRKDF